MALYGGIEAGGTKFVCAIGTGPDDIRAETRFATTNVPADAINQAIAFFKANQGSEPLAAIGVASFGPLDPDPRSRTFGYVTTTPKPGWAPAPIMVIVGKGWLPGQRWKGVGKPAPKISRPTIPLGN